MRLRQAVGLLIAALIPATGALADVRGVRNPPSFTAQEAELIGRDPRLVGITKRCGQQLRQALDALAGMKQGSRVGIVIEPCPAAANRQDRASDEGALDILKILKDISEQGAGRTGGADVASGAPEARSPSFTSEEIALIHKDKSGKLRFASRHCAWQLRRAFDSLRYGARDWPPQRPCVEESTRSSAEGALDILKILREASEESNN
jgi:hypothetical protein